MAYANNPNVIGPSEQAGQPNATQAAASSIRAVTWPYNKWASQSNEPRVALRPPVAAPDTEDPLILAIQALQQVMQGVLRTNRLISAPWLLMPPDGESLHQAGGIAMPAVDGNYHAILTIVCPAGRNGIINQIANTVVGGAFADFSGAFQWQIQRNPSSGITAAERNYQLIQAQLGLIDAPAPIAPIRIFENDVIVLAGQNLSLPSPGPSLGGLFGGWFYPRTWDDQWDARDRDNAW